MPGKLLKTVLWCGLLVLLAGGLLTVAGSQAAGAVKPEVVTKEATSGQIVNLRFATKLASFVPRQELYEHGGGRISASIQIHEENRETFMDVDGGRLTLIRANGEHLVTAHVEHKGTLLACNPRAMYFARTHTFEMVPTLVAAQLDSNERIRGTLILQVENKEYIFALPETRADVSE